MTGSSTAAGAHGPMIRTEPRELTKLRRRVEAVVDLCLGSMSARPNAAGIVDADTVWPTQVLDALQIDYGPGSDLAYRSDDQR